MAQVLVIAGSAETDLAEAFKWYEERSVGLGHEFLRCVDAKLGVIVRDPQLFRKRFAHYRLAATARFPYAIYFIWDEAQSRVVVRRVLHFAQDAHPRL
jgi:plasmid stabilization system protein ParE